MKLWILLEEYNEYDQHGGYFVAAFSSKPTELDLEQFRYDHFGRENGEYTWVYLEEVSLRKPLKSVL